jgi:MOSC domain-containing protein YiiM
VASGRVIQVSMSRGGIPKHAIGQAHAGPLGLEGDGHAQPQFHGGPRQALLLITQEGIEELNAAGFPLQAGTLGENITTRGLDRRQWRIGQRWRIGPEVIVEFTKIRVPCKTLSRLGKGIQAAIYDEIVKAGDPSSPRWGLSGLYASVVEPGTIRTGDEIVLVR